MSEVVLEGKREKVPALGVAPWELLGVKVTLLEAQGPALLVTLGDTRAEAVGAHGE